MNTNLLSSTFIVCVVMLQLSSAHGSAFYTYTGNNYNFIETGTAFDETMSVNGTLELSTTLAPDLTFASVIPLSFSFNNGLDTLDDTSNFDNAESFGYTEFIFSTDSVGNITAWSIVLHEAIPSPPSVGDRIARIATFNNFLNPGDSGDVAEAIECTGVFDNRCYVITTWEKAWALHNPGTWSLTQVSPIVIDIKPNKKTDENVIYLKRGKGLKVAIVGSITFDALQVDPATVKFGPSEASPVRFKGQDYNRDGYSDLILTFKLSETGISCGDEEATLVGATYTGEVIEGSDEFTVQQCPLR